MSTYLGRAINPRSGETQKALFIDDFYGQHQYGVAFRKDDNDASEEHDLFGEILIDNYDIYPIYEVEISREEK